MTDDRELDIKDLVHLRGVLAILLDLQGFGMGSSLFLGSIFPHQTLSSSGEVRLRSVSPHCFGADIVKRGPGR